MKYYKYYNDEIRGACLFLFDDEKGISILSPKDASKIDMDDINSVFGDAPGFGRTCKSDGGNITINYIKSLKREFLLNKLCIN